VDVVRGGVGERHRRSGDVALASPERPDAVLVDAPPGRPSDRVAVEPPLVAVLADAPPDPESFDGLLLLPLEDVDLDAPFAVTGLPPPRRRRRSPSRESSSASLSTGRSVPCGVSVSLGTAARGGPP